MAAIKRAVLVKHREQAEFSSSFPVRAQHLNTASKLIALSAIHRTPVGPRPSILLPPFSICSNASRAICASPVRVSARELHEMARHSIHARARPRLRRHGRTRRIIMGASFVDTGRAPVYVRTESCTPYLARQRCASAISCARSMSAFVLNYVGARAFPRRRRTGDKRGVCASESAQAGLRILSCKLEASGARRAWWLFVAIIVRSRRRASATHPRRADSSTAVPTLTSPRSARLILREMLIKTLRGAG